jgi:hypothetical protein
MIIALTRHEQWAAIKRRPREVAMNRYRVDVSVDLQAEDESEAIEFLESTFGDVDPDPSRVMVLEVHSGEVVDTPEWVVKAIKNVDRR